MVHPKFPKREKKRYLLALLTTPCRAYDRERGITGRHIPASSRDRAEHIGRNAMSYGLKSLVVSSACLSAFFLASAQSFAGTSCTGLASLTLPHATVTTAQAVTGGSFTPPGSPTPLTGLPPFCRVAVTSTPTSDSIINLEVWIPLTGWNGKYEQLGCGGFCGSIGYSGLAEAVRRGYASAATDDGDNTGGLPTFALGHPQKIIDFGY